MAKKQKADPSPALAAEILTATIAECVAAGLKIGARVEPAAGDRPAGLVLFVAGLGMDTAGAVLVLEGAQNDG